MPSFHIRVQAQDGEQLYVDDRNLKDVEQAEKFAQSVTAAQPDRHGDCEWIVATNDTSIYKEEKK